MRPRILLPFLMGIGGMLIPSAAVFAQTGAAGLPASSGSGFGWYKLLILAAFYLLWVWLSDRINRDLLRWGPSLELAPETWNLIQVLCFGISFLLVLALPWFWASIPLLILAAVVPGIVYRSIRKNRMAANPELAFQASRGASLDDAAPLAQDEGVSFDFSPAGESEEQRAANLIKARQSPAFVQMKELLVTAITNRADLLLLDYTQQAVGGKMMVDGAWHNLPWMDRATGDAILFSLKSLAGLNPADRRTQQLGKFGLKWLDMSLKANFELISAGVPTGERVQLKSLRTASKDLTLSQLGMWPEMQTALIGAMNQKGLVLFSAPPRMGLTSTWRSALLACDRITRDCMGLIPAGDTETEVENLQVRRYHQNDQAEVYRGLMLMQPDALAIPELMQTSLMNPVLQEVVDEGRAVYVKTTAENAPQALLTAWAKAPNRQNFARALVAVTGQRLLRRLCDHCKQPVVVRPEAIQKLGGDPRRQNTIYNHYQLPPPEQRVDEKGQPIEMFPCPVCQGLGFIGRIAAFELIRVDDGLRALLLKEPKLDKVEAYLRSQGQLSQLQQAYRLVLVGVTSVAEVQRVFSKGSS